MILLSLCIDAKVKWKPRLGEVHEIPSDRNLKFNYNTLNDKITTNFDNTELHLFFKYYNKLEDVEDVDFSESKSNLDVVDPNSKTIKKDNQELQALDHEFIQNLVNYGNSTVRTFLVIRHYIS